jgi:Tfp pilus assembly protein PilZ
MIILPKENNDALIFVEKRNRERIKTNIDARFFHANVFYCGTVANVTDSGIFISTEKFLPINTVIVIVIRLEHELLKTIGKVRRINSTSDSVGGMGVALLSPSKTYLDLVSKIKSV